MRSKRSSLQTSFGYRFSLSNLDPLKFLIAQLVLFFVFWGTIGVVSLGRSAETESLNRCFFFGGESDNRWGFFKGSSPSVDCSSGAAFSFSTAWIQLDSSKIDSYKRALLTRNMLVQETCSFKVTRMRSTATHPCTVVQNRQTTPSVGYWIYTRRLIN